MRFLIAATPRRSTEECHDSCKALVGLLIEQLVIQIPCRRNQEDVTTGDVAIARDVLGCFGLDQFDNVIEFDWAG